MAKFISNTFPDLKIDNGKGVVATFKDGVFETKNDKAIEFLRTSKSCTELKPEPPAKATPPKGDDKPKDDKKPEPPETKKTGE